MGGRTNAVTAANGSQKLIEIDDERRLRVFMDKYALEASEYTRKHS